MAKSLRKPFGRSQASLKERIKERNKKWTGLGKAYEPLSTSANGTSKVLWLPVITICPVLVLNFPCVMTDGSLAASSPVRLKSIQANNRALALALQEEKLKVREARDAFLCLKGENQCLKFQIFYLQTLLQSQQVQAPAEVF